jgi:hypothetical protein
MTDNVFLTPETFLVTIEIIMEEKRINHLDAIMEYCDMHGIDVEEVVPLITRPLKEKIKIDAQEAGMMKQEARLPL